MGGTPWNLSYLGGAKTLTFQPYQGISPQAYAIGPQISRGDPFQEFPPPMYASGIILL